MKIFLHNYYYTIQEYKIGNIYLFNCSLDGLHLKNPL